MIITCKNVAEKLTAYLHRHITSEEIAEWAESAMTDADFEDQHFELIRDIVSHLGVADVRAFGITFEDCEDFLSRLGYHVSVRISEAEAA